MTTNTHPKNIDCPHCKVETDYVIHIRYNSFDSDETLHLLQCPICKRVYGRTTEE